MRRGPLLALAALVAAAAVPAPGGLSALPGVADPARAHVDYMVKCQGCHHPDGGGNAVNTPPLAGEVARFLAVPGGREFLGRVPGVASTDLDDARLAQLLNWTLYRFDRQHLPAGFKPYTAAEMATLRRHPLRLERVATRAALIEQLHHKQTN